MSLTGRLSAFFLGALACVLAGFSGSLYFLAHAHLHRQASARVQATLDVLVAAAETEPGSVEWDLHDRLLSFVAGDPNDSICWAVADGDGGEWVDGSADEEASRFFAGHQVEQDGSRKVSFRGQRWSCATRRLTGGTLPSSAPREPGHRKFSALVFTAAVPLGAAQATLRGLAILLSGLSVSLWLFAALVGRGLCRRALRPLTRMAEAARQITVADLGWRVPNCDTRDEVEDLGRAFNDLLARLEESFERQRRFTGDASHQLRTPLTAVLGQIDVTLRRERDPQEYRRTLSSVQGQATRLIRIVEGLLFLARADAEALAPRMDVIDLTRWLDDHLTAWSGHLRGADFHLEPNDGPPLWVQVHAPLLAQAVDNLLENACKYSPPGLPIVVRIWQEQDSACLCVEDHGRGIAADDLAHVFEPFYRSPAVRLSGEAGVGLGLAVAARIVKALGGQIAVTSTLGQGAQFTIRLPTVGQSPVASIGADQKSTRL
jgi:heavy metal sensor kinase